jgi:menaquinol-cytochrome c reductase iron-sulfur subunit
MGDETQFISPDKPGATRRSFLKMLIGMITFFMGIILAIPFIGSLIGSRLKKEKLVWYKVADMNSLPEGRPEKLNFFSRMEDAYRHETVMRSIWVIRHSLSDVTVFSPICTHLGCYYKWDATAGRFECPCHLSLFSLNGKVLGGPAPRPLDTLPAKIENGILYVVWEQFKVGIPEKVAV